MRIAVALLPALLAALVSAQSSERRLVDLIPPDARFVYGSDVVRYEQSGLCPLYPNGIDGLREEEWQPHVRRLIVVERALGSDGGRLTILRGTVGALFASAKRDEESTGFALLDASTAVIGNAANLSEAASRWKSASSSELAAKALQLSEAYDNWFIAVRPFAEMEHRMPAGQKLTYVAEMASLVTEVRGGIRFGGRAEVHVEVEMKTAEDAMAAAALARWLPGFVQAKSPYGTESALVELAENVTVIQSGNTVSLSFTLDESKLEELRKARSRDSEDAAATSCRE